jgi:hypothetical protein
MHGTCFSWEKKKGGATALLQSILQDAFEFFSSIDLNKFAYCCYERREIMFFMEKEEMFVFVG